MRHLLLLGFVFLIYPYFSSATEKSDIYVGVLRSHCGKKEDCKGHLYPAFKKTNGSWTVLSVLPEARDWTIVFDAKNKGLLKASDVLSLEKGYSYFTVSEKNKTSWISTNQKVFMGWEGNEKYRPMVVVSEPNFSDPDLWKPYTLNMKEKEELWRALQKTFKEDFNEMKCMPKVTAKCAVQLKNVKFQEAYKSKDKQVVAKLLLETPLEGEFEDTKKTIFQWYSFNSENPTKAKELIGSKEENIWDVSLIDAGDFDKSGHSKLVFWLAGYNMNGFLLVDESFNILGKYEFSYH